MGRYAVARRVVEQGRIDVYENSASPSPKIGSRIGCHKFNKRMASCKLCLFEKMRSLHARKTFSLIAKSASI